MKRKNAVFALAATPPGQRKRKVDEMSRHGGISPAYYGFGPRETCFAWKRRSKGAICSFASQGKT